MHLRNTFVKYSYMHEESLYVAFRRYFSFFTSFLALQKKKEKITKWKKMIFLCTCKFMFFFERITNLHTYQQCTSFMSIFRSLCCIFCEKRLSPDATKILKKCSIVSTNDKYYFISLIFFVDKGQTKLHFL